MEEIIYFEINNWFAGRDYPDDEIFSKWINNYTFRNDEYCKENKLCVMCGAIDMSMNYCVAAPKSWVLENCPDLLSDKECTYQIATYNFKEDKQEIKTFTKKYSDFLCYPDEDGEVCGHIADDWYFPEYCEKNFGVTWNNSWWGKDEDDGDDDEDDNEDYLNYDTGR